MRLIDWREEFETGVAEVNRHMLGCIKRELRVRPEPRRQP